VGVLTVIVVVEREGIADVSTGKEGAVANRVGVGIGENPEGIVVGEGAIVDMSV